MMAARWRTDPHARERAGGKIDERLVGFPRRPGAGPGLRISSAAFGLQTIRWRRQDGVNVLLEVGIRRGHARQHWRATGLSMRRMFCSGRPFWRPPSTWLKRVASRENGRRRTWPRHRPDESGSWRSMRSASTIWRMAVKLGIAGVAGLTHRAHHLVHLGTDQRHGVGEAVGGLGQAGTSSRLSVRRAASFIGPGLGDALQHADGRVAGVGRVACAALVQGIEVGTDRDARTFELVERVHAAGCGVLCSLCHLLRQARARSRACPSSPAYLVEARRWRSAPAVRLPAGRSEVDHPLRSLPVPAPNAHRKNLTLKCITYRPVRRPA